jgi:rsbT co-antagonist protein RsbR
MSIDTHFNLGAEMSRDALAALVAERDRLRDELERVQKERQREQHLAVELLMNLPAGVCYIQGPELIFELANDRYLEITGRRAILGKPIREAMPEVAAQGFEDLLRRVYTSGEAHSATDVHVHIRQGGDDGPLRELWCDFVYQPTRDANGNIQGILVLFVDVTEKAKQRALVEQLNAEHAALQDELIRTQQGMLRELATPLVPVADEVIAMPLVGVIDTERANQILETLLQGVIAQRARVALLDVTGVRTMDTQAAEALIRAARAAQLLGAKVVLTGLSPLVAQTLVSLGVDFTGIPTLRSLQVGIAHALGPRLGADESIRRQRESPRSILPSRGTGEHAALALPKSR